MLSSRRGSRRSGGRKSLDQELYNACAHGGKPPPCSGETALHAAARNGRLEIVHVLLNAGADPNTQDDLGYSPLHRAIEGGHSSVVQALVDAGGDMQLRTLAEHVPLHVAFANSQYETAERMVNLGAWRLCGSSCMKCRLGMKLLAKRGVVPDRKKRRSKASGGGEDSTADGVLGAFGSSAKSLGVGEDAAGDGTKKKKKKKKKKKRKKKKKPEADSEADAAPDAGVAEAGETGTTDTVASPSAVTPEPEEQPSPASAASKQLTSEAVFEEYFDGVDLFDEIAKLKAEFGGAGISGGSSKASAKKVPSDPQSSVFDNMPEFGGAGKPLGDDLLAGLLDNSLAPLSRTSSTNSRSHG